MLSPIWLLILLAIIIVVLCILLLFYVVLRKARKTPPPEPLEPSAIVEVKSTEAAPIGFIQFASASSLGLGTSFRNALRVLRTYVTGSNYRYRLPWFLMIGESQSGKTTLLGNTGLNLPVGNPTEHVRGIKQGLNWCFFDNGVVLDVSGDYVLRPEGETANSAGWNTISRLLQKYRSERPIDGVILTIPCTDLIGAKTLTPDHRAKLERKATALYRKLWQAQKVLGMSFPVYILITKCDQVAGFKSLCNEVPRHLQNDIFGWSSPYTLETAYQSEWVNEAFRSLHRYLFQIQIELFAERGEVQDSDGLFLLPTEIQSMRGPLQVYLDHFFKESSFHDSYFFRGLYFCGDSTVEAPATAAAAALPLNETEPTIDWLVQTPDPFQPPPPVAPEAGIRRPVFLKHLFERKIFQEHFLAQPIAKTLLSRNRTVLACQILSLAIPVLGGLGLLVTYNDLRNREQALYELLETELRDLDDVRQLYGQEGGLVISENRPLISKSRPLMQMAAYLQPAQSVAPPPVAPVIEPAVNEVRDEEENLIDAMSKVSNRKLISPFIPSSWFSGVNDRIENSLIAAFKYIVFDTLRLDLEIHTDTLLASGAYYTPPLSTETFNSHVTVPSSNRIDEQPASANPNYELSRFITQLGALFVNRARYERLRKQDSGSTDDIEKLIEYLGHARLPDNFDQGNPLFQRALRVAEGDPLKLTPAEVQRLGALKVTQIIEDIYESSFERQGVTYYYLTEIAQTEALLARPEYTWMASYVLIDPHSAFHNMTVSAALRELRKALEGLSKERFMSRDPSLRPGAQLLLRRRLTWNKEPLRQAIVYYQEYQNFIESKASNHSEKLDNSVKQAALAELKGKINGLISQAQVYQHSERVAGESLLKTSIIAEVKSLEDAQDILAQLMEICDRLQIVGLRRAVAEQAVSLVRLIDREFAAERFYAMREDNFAWWKGSKPLSYTAFGVSSPDELASYLAIQRKRIAYLGRELAAPVFNFLAAQNIAPPQSFVDWNEILTELDGYENKKPGNSVSILENFIRFEMDRVNLDDCSELIRQSNGSAGDFFLQQRNFLRRQLYQRCEQLAKNRVLETFLDTLADYRDIEQAFNNTLAGRFPFANIVGDQNFAEADPEAIIAFFKLLDRKKKGATDALLRSTYLGAAQDDALEFLRQMEEVRVFFADFLEKKQFPIFDFDVQFRVNRDEEKGANQIIDWNLEVGKKRFRMLDEDRTGRWLFGQPIRLSLRWANDSPTVPVTGTTVPRVRVRERTATLEYNNSWSLLALIMRHRGDLLRHRGTPPPDAVEYIDIEPYTLKFTIPTRIAALSPPLEQAQREDLRTAPAEVFMRVSLLAPNKKEPLILPSKFPTKAPQLSFVVPEDTNRK